MRSGRRIGGRAGPRLARAAIGGALFALALLVGRARAGEPDARAAEPPLELAGTWHVLIHYRDASSANPGAWHWDEKIWVFEPGEGELRWTEYPIVLFSDDSGRFESLGSARQSRVLHAWEPNAGQRAQIRSGLEVNSRGRNSKRLRGSDAEGWRSGDRLVQSASQLVSYVEDWSVEGLPAAPVFTQRDLMGASEEDSLEGVTRYATAEIRAGGDELRGGFTRDESRSGRFEMRRSGPVKPLGERSQEEIRRRLGVPQP